MADNMWAEWPVVMGVGTVILLGLNYAYTKGSQYLTLREHQEFKTYVNTELSKLHQGQVARMTIEEAVRNLKEVEDGLHRELDAVDRRISKVENRYINGDKHDDNEHKTKTR